MTARLLHAVLQSPIDYDGWLAEAQRDRPDYFIILDDGGDALIALEWAKAVAFHADNSPSSRLALNLIVRALNESPGDKGAAADDLFSQAFTNSELEPDDGVDPYILRRAQEGKSDSIRRYEFQAEHPANRI